MQWYTGVMVYIIIWWLIFFMALPFGSHPPEHVETGHADSAPEKPRLWRKALVSAVIAGAVFAAVFYVIDNDMISFRQM